MTLPILGDLLVLVEELDFLHVYYATQSQCKGQLASDIYSVLKGLKTESLV